MQWLRGAERVRRRPFDCEHVEWGEKQAEDKARIRETFYPFAVSWLYFSKLEPEKIVPGSGLVQASGMTDPRKGGMRKVFLLFFGFAVLVPVGGAQNAADSYRKTVLTIQEHIQANDLTGARALLANAVKLFPSNGGIENLVGIVEVQQGYPEVAKQAFSMAIQH